ncbi:MAG TPA: type II toxin-antitoxin system RelE/ParE family toxin [Pyrinomonadaceae bacterium]|nr:type II toxin-antitoxin system RelE/ParE family toxin [Pyrinomonadaceae bacterium]
MKIFWTEPAVEDLRELHDYIARDSQAYASRFVERLFSAVERLSDHPKLGRLVPEANDDDIRELLYRSYRIIYRVTSRRVAVLAVIHGARDLGSRDPAPWDVE